VNVDELANLDEPALYRPDGSASDGPWRVSITPESAGWAMTGLKVVELGENAEITFSTGSTEVLVLPLAGSCVVECDGEKAELAGRASVFSGGTDFVYAPRDAELTIRTAIGGRFAVPAAEAEHAFPFRHVEASEVEAVTRGAGNCSRLVRNHCMPETFEADRLLVCEVITPGGNWSSYPPHKHDEERDGETVLEEIYYFEVADSPQATPGVAYQRVYGTPQRPIDLFAEVGSGDVVLIPHGWHGPSMAVPGYDLYYLNAMAGPGPRAWGICDDPAHGWIRDTWADQQVDPRVVTLLPAERRG
jgi:5-deoxy-glucuronate isomerase